MAKQKPPTNKIVSSGTTSRQFAYSNGNIHLSFTLRVDKADRHAELRAFLAMLKQAVIDVGDQISSTQ